MLIDNRRYINGSKECSRLLARSFAAVCATSGASSRIGEEPISKREMVLWEITAITAYFLGLKRTYRLALRLQRRLIGPNHPRIRQFIHRRTRSVFDVAVSVHKNIQQRDIEVGRNLGNWILRRLHSMKPSAQIRVPASGVPSTSSNLPEHIAKTNQSHAVKENNIKATDKSNGRMLFSSLNTRLKHIPAMPMMSEVRRSAEWNSPCSRISSKPYSFSSQTCFPRWHW